MTVPNNLEITKPSLDQRVQEINHEIDWLKQLSINNAGATARLNELAGELTYIARIDQASQGLSDGKIQRKEKREWRHIAKDQNKFHQSLGEIKKSLGLDEFAKPPVDQVKVFNPSPETSVEMKDGQFLFTGVDAKGNKSTNNVGRVPTQEEKKESLDRIDNGIATTEDYKIVGMGLMDHMVTKNTHATPEQAKMLKYGAVAAGGIMLWKFLQSNGGVFSLNGMATLGAIYAGTTMATGMNPLEFANSIINGGKYPLLGVDDTKGPNGEKSEIKKSLDASQFSDQLINGFKDPVMISKYIKTKLPTSAGGVTPTNQKSELYFDVNQLLQDVSVDGRPINDVSNLKSALDQDKINKIFGPYNGHSANELMAMILGFTQSGQTDLLNKALTDHFTNIDSNSSNWAGLLSNPNDLKEKSKKFKEDLINNAKTVTEQVMKKPEFSGYSIAENHEAAILNQMMRMEKAKDKTFNQSPTAYAPTANIDYILLQQQLIASGDIVQQNLANSPEAKSAMIGDIKNKINGLILPKEQLKFATAFTKIKSLYDPEGIHGLELRVQNNRIWIQSSSAAFTFSGQSEASFNIDFSGANTSVSGTANTGLSSFEDKIAFAMAACVLAGKTAGNIVPPANKDADKNKSNIYAEWPFKANGKSISVQSETTRYGNFFGSTDYKVVDQIMKGLENKGGSNKPARQSLCALLNGMQYIKGQHAGESVWLVNKGKLPEDMMPIGEDGKRMNAGFSAAKEYVVSTNPTLKAAISSFFADVADVGGSFYSEIIKSSAKELYGDAKSAIDQIYGDAIKGVHQVYDDVASGSKLMLVDLKNGGSKLLFTTTTQLGKDMTTSVVDITGHATKEIYQKLLGPLYKEIKLQAPKLLKDAELASGAIYNSLKKGGKALESDMKSWLSTSGKDWYENFLKKAGIALYSDASKGLDVIGKDIGAKLAGIGTWTVESFFGAIGLTADQASKFQGEYPKLSGLITGLGMNMAGISDGPSIIGGIAVMIMGMFK